MARKAAPVVEDLELEETEEIEEDELELEDEADDEEPAPAKSKKGKAAAPAKAKAPAKTTSGYGASWLAEYVTDQTGNEVSASAIRVLLRKMAKDENSALSREVGADRSRYSFTGENDKIVKAVLKAVKGGALTRSRDDNLAAARAAKAAKSTGTAAKATTRKSKVTEVEADAPAKPVTRKRKG